MYKKKAHIHFVGIGGIGMSGIAKILKYQGYTISGCDLDIEQKSTIDLHALGCSIYKGNNTASCHDLSINIVVYSSDIKSNHEEIIRAQQRGIPTIPRALMLAELMRIKYSIAITGAHGKTTTTSLIAHILMEAAYDPTVIIGGHLKSLSTNAHFGHGDFLVAEADESDRTLVKLQPTLAVITNIDREHLDTYRDLDDIKDTFKLFLANIPFYGAAVMCHDDPHTRSILPRQTGLLNHVRTITYGSTTQADLYAQEIELGANEVQCTVWDKLQNRQLGPLLLKMPGKHNLLNALAATAIARELDIPFEQITSSLATFKGVDRRFSFRGTYKGAEVFDDYGHHPNEIHHTLLVARQRTRKKLIVVFQPHRYTRMYHLWNDFIRVLLEHPLDYLIITDIHAASETPLPDITSYRLVEELKAQGLTRVEYVPLDHHFTSLQQALSPLSDENSLVLLLGAGSINKLADKLQNTNNQ